jgi:predicted Rossmann fold flavoprotein
MNAKVSAFSAGRLLAEDSGQIQWTQSDLSGIVTFQVSQTVTRALSRGQDVELSLDLLPALNREELSSSLRKLSSRNLDLTVEELLLGFLPALMIPVVLSTLPESLSLRKSGSLTEADFQSISRALKALRLKALSVRGFDSCQVCAGGVSLSELNPLSLEAEKSALQGLYLAGELLDLDGPCGGYNLQWAWSSGWTAGKHAGISARSGD